MFESMIKYQQPSKADSFFLKKTDGKKGGIEYFILSKEVFGKFPLESIRTLDEL